MFLLAVACVLGFLASYVWINIHQHPEWSNIALGTTLGGALLFIGAAAIVWAKGITPHEDSVQERHPDNSKRRGEGRPRRRVADGGQRERCHPPQDAAGDGLSMGALAVPPLFLLRDLGPSPFSGKERGHHLLDVTAWQADQHLVDIVTLSRVTKGRRPGRLTDHRGARGPSPTPRPTPP